MEFRQYISWDFAIGECLPYFRRYTLGTFAIGECLIDESLIGERGPPLGPEEGRGG